MNLALVEVKAHPVQGFNARKDFVMLFISRSGLLRVSSFEFRVSSSGFIVNVL